MSVSISESVFNPPFGEFPWINVDTIPQLERGLLFSTLTWEVDGQKFQLPWLMIRNPSQVSEQLSTYWCSSRESLLNKVVTNITKTLSVAYPRTATLDKMKLLANKTIKLWPATLNEQWLCEQGLKDYKTLKTLANLQQNDLKKLQAAYINLKKVTYKSFFEQVEKNPLTDLQQNACIINEENNLVLAGAGTGKTSTMVGRAGYLLLSKQATADEILLLAYGKQAALEMKQRLNSCLNNSDIQTNTFHSLGLKIISEVEGETPTISSLCVNNNEKQQWVNTQFNYLLGIEKYASLTVQYIFNHYYGGKSWFDVASKGEYFQYIKDNNIRTLKGELVENIGELKIANWLYTHDIDYDYKSKYKSKLEHGSKLNYKPAFYLPKHNIYVEHWQLNIDKNTPSFIDKEQYLSYIEWVKSIHETNNTVFIETLHSDVQLNTLVSKLAEKMQHQQIEPSPPSMNDLLVKIKHSGALEQIVDLLVQMLSPYKSVWLNKELIKTKVGQFTDRNQLDAFLRLLLPIFKLYQEMLNANNEIDFDDMIGKAFNYVKDGSFQSPYRFILVDEFQDISEPRARLIKALKESNPEGSIFCVGDDWQSIYRFAGSDVTLTTNFEDYFGPSSISVLDKTFRFNNSINEVASRFVMKNPNQISKHLTTHIKVAKAAVTLCTKGNGALNDILSSISAQLEENEAHVVFILSRYAYALPSTKELHVFKQQYSNLNIQTSTFHASKGLEADSVILLGLESGKNGFPAVKTMHPLLNAILPAEESFTYAEERRLFYVALTRAKKQVYLCTDSNRQSVFVKELLAEDYPISVFEQNDENGSKVADVKSSSFEQQQCRECNTGLLIEKHSKNGIFFGCSNYPLCGHTESVTVLG